MNKKQTGGVNKTKKKTVKDGYETKLKIKSKRRGKITKYKKDERLLADEPSKGGVLRTKVKTKLKDGKLKKKVTKVIDKEGSRKTTTRTRVTKRGSKTKIVIWENGKRKVIKMRDGKVVKKKGYQTGGFLESPIEEI